MIKLAVFGDPIRHSLSPQIHHAFGEQAGLRVEYLRILASPAGLRERFQQFADEGGVGANITLPLKQVSLDLADDLSTEAQEAGALNTLILKNGTWNGANTDGLGLVHDLLRLRGALAGARVLLVGAGGAARGVVGPLMRAGIASVHVVNRTPERAEALVQHFLQRQPTWNLSAGALTSMPNSDFDVVINATATGLTSERPQLPDRVLRCKPLCYDMVYGDKATHFMQWALGYQCQVEDGLGMLVGQAAESFRLWTGVSPDITTVTQQLRLQLGQWSDS
ncbi:MAG: shikimate dehydrogenase [Idiomarina sp.]|nr:shikimate dehydrogenase [Idiomarina sp.]